MTLRIKTAEQLVKGDRLVNCGDPAEVPLEGAMAYVEAHPDWPRRVRAVLRLGDHVAVELERNDGREGRLPSNFYEPHVRFWVLGAPLLADSIP